MRNRIPRPHYQQLLTRYRDTEFVKVLTGVRRCGKSALLDLFIEDLHAQGVPEENVFRKRFDEFGLPLNPTAEDLQDEIAAALDCADPSHMFYVALDEKMCIRDRPVGVYAGRGRGSRRTGGAAPRAWRRRLRR